MCRKNFGRINSDVQDVDLWSSLPRPLPSLRCGGDGGPCCQDAASWCCLPAHPAPCLPSSILASLLKPCPVKAPQGQRPWRVHPWISSGNFLKMGLFTPLLDFMKMEHTSWETSRSPLILCALTSNFLLIRDVSWNTMLSFLKAMP